MKSKGTGRLCVVIIDDDRDALFLTTRIVRHVRPEFQVREYLSPVEALEKLLPLTKARRPLAVFVDLNMPLVDGFEVLSSLRQQPTFAHVLKVVLSSSSQVSDVEQAFLCGANAYLVKNVQPADMVVVLAAAEEFRNGTAAQDLRLPGLWPESSRRAEQVTADKRS